MRIVLTGASSFTGLWLTRALLEAGHEVVAPLRGEEGSYSGVREQRVLLLQSAGAQLVWSCPFGSDAFIAVMDDGADVLCHHAARVENYKSIDFDVHGAVHENTRGLQQVLAVGKANGLRGIVATGSVFEYGEGAGEAPLRAFSPYGLSKGLTYEILRFWAGHFQLPLGKFVIPNPFGPYEEPRFCAYLLQCWAQEKTAVVKTPDYVRDNIHVSLLAKAYAEWVTNFDSRCRETRLGPSGYVESQGAFALRFGREIGRRLDIATPLELAVQSEFSEPFARINTDRLRHGELGWNEEEAWDELAEYYRQVYLPGTRRRASA
ncbi:MAG: NAD-dependent epimerase/dehydratase family protein [Rhodospirillaceae bacterium]